MTTLPEECQDPIPRVLPIEVVDAIDPSLRTIDQNVEWRQCIQFEASGLGHTVRRHLVLRWFRMDANQRPDTQARDSRAVLAR